AEVDDDRLELDSALAAVEPARRHEEVEQRRVPTGLVDEHEAACTEAGQRALGDDRGEHRGDRAVDRVATLAQRPGAGLRGCRMAAGDDAPAHGRAIRRYLVRDELRNVDAEVRGALLVVGNAPGAGGLAAPRRGTGRRAVHTRRAAVGTAAAGVEAGRDHGHPDLLVEG